MTVIRMLEDLDSSVVKAALTLIRDHPSQVSYTSIALRRGADVTKDDQIRSKGKGKANEIFATESSLIDSSNIGLIIEALKTIESLGQVIFCLVIAFLIFWDRLMDSSIPILFELLRSHLEQPLSKALTLGIFKALSLLDSDAFAAGEDSARVLAVRAVGHYLLSTSMNEIYLFLSCLECVDIVNWAGASPDRPPSLQEEAFERIMQMLNTSDETIRKKAGTSFRE